MDSDSVIRRLKARMGPFFFRVRGVLKGASHASARAGQFRPFAGRALRRLRGERVLDWVVGGIVLALYAAVQFAFLQGPYPFDSAKYFRTAVDFPSVRADIWTLRIGLVVPVRVAVLLFGPSEAALYAVPIVVGLVLAAAVYGTMLLLFGDRILAAGASLVTVLNTNYLLKSSSIFPDTTATATFTAGFFCLLAGARRWEGRGERWGPTVLAVCAGVLFGWTYLIREFSWVLTPAVLASVALLRYPVRRAAILFGAALATVSLELLYGFVRYGEPFIHARVLRGERFRPPQTNPRVIEHIQGELDSLFDTMIAFPRLLLAWQTGWIFLLLLAMFLVVIGARFRDKRVWLLAVWCFSFWILMAILGLGSLPSGRWIVNITIIRYWYPIFPPLVMGAFAALALLIPRHRVVAGGIPLVAVAGALLTSLVVVPGLIEFKHCEAKNVWVNDPAERWYQLRAWFATPEADRYDVIWTDGRSYQLLPAFTSSRFGDLLWDGAVNRLPRDRRRVVAPAGRPRSLILVNRGRSLVVTKLEDVRREWSPIFISDDGRMILLAHASAPSSEARGPDNWWTVSEGRLITPAEPGTCGRPWAREMP
jgi:hypothetical protein